MGPLSCRVLARNKPQETLTRGQEGGRGAAAVFVSRHPSAQGLRGPTRSHLAGGGFVPTGLLLQPLAPGPGGVGISLMKEASLLRHPQRQWGRERPAWAPLSLPRTPSGSHWKLAHLSLPPACPRLRPSMLCASSSCWLLVGWTPCSVSLCGSPPFAENRQVKEGREKWSRQEERKSRVVRWKSLCEEHRRLGALRK